MLTQIRGSRSPLYPKRIAILVKAQKGYDGLIFYTRRVNTMADQMQQEAAELQMLQQLLQMAQSGDANAMPQMAQVIQQMIQAQEAEMKEMQGQSGQGPSLEDKLRAKMQQQKPAAQPAPQGGDDVQG